MKIVKTQKNWKLHKRGYKVAFRFQRHILPQSFSRIVEWLEANRGPKAIWSWDHENPDVQWTCEAGRSKRWQEAHPYFIGLKNEADVTAILLSLNLHVEQ
jgi:hypothetical protein